MRGWLFFGIFGFRKTPLLGESKGEEENREEEWFHNEHYIMGQITSFAISNVNISNM